MHFQLVDRVLEHEPGRIVAIKVVSAAEEYLQDHFPTFPILPGVFMLEALVQAARRLVELDGGPPRLVLGGVRALKYGTFVAPGDAMRIVVTHAGLDDEAVACRGEAAVLRAGAEDAAPPTCVAGRFTVRPLRIRGDHAARPPAAAADR